MIKNGAFWFTWFYFQDIMDVCSFESNKDHSYSIPLGTFVNERIRLAKLYRQHMNFDPQCYTIGQCWNLVIKKFDKHFDEVIYMQQEGLKERIKL